MKLFQTPDGLAVMMEDGSAVAVDLDLDAIFTSEDPFGLVAQAIEGAHATEIDTVAAPIGRQEVWAAGVTYIRSRSARMAESEHSGGDSFYDRVYTADRPELFFKSTPSRVSDPGGFVRIRRDSNWSVPEPELVLAITSRGRLFGYSIGNDVSARDIEGENPLYLPQAKVYAGSCSLGPCILLSDAALPGETEIVMEILRDGAGVYRGTTTLDSLKRSLDELINYLFRENVFPDGCYLFTGTGIVPPDDFTLHSGDVVSITIAPIGTLVNVAA